MGDTIMADDQIHEESQVRAGYEFDRTLKGYVIPSHKGPMGGSHGFDPNKPNIKQNIIACEDNNMVKVAEVTTDKLSTLPDDVAKMSEDDRVEYFKTLDAREKVEEEVAKQALEAAIAVEAIPAAPAIKGPVVQQTPMLPTHMEVQPIVNPEPVELINVTIKGPFGKIRQPFTSVFRDGINLVLMSDHQVQPTAYELPELDSGEIMELEVAAGSTVVQCIWAGISFTLPDGSVTFTVLLVQEETQVEERELG